MTDRERVSRETFASRANVLLALRMSCWVFALPFAKRAVAIERLARFMWRDDELGRDPKHELFVTRLACRLTRFSGRNCLDRSLMLYRYLGRAGASPTLVLGIDRASPGRGHAWVVVDGTPVVESADDIEAYEPVVAFGAGGLVNAAVTVA